MPKISSKSIFDCEHILFCYEKISDRPKFFFKVRRQRHSTFWTEELLVLRPEHRISTSSTSSGANEIESGNGSESDDVCSEDNVVNFEDDEEEDFGLEDGDTNIPLRDLC